ncbi:Lipase [Macleaya cordata]|uniref:Lipase n=1 Tax=Macleaya cordata TaxID=56857 RepID=A0A200R0L0_MACCD|nr:Lipase [Macleaya cordata]
MAFISSYNMSYFIFFLMLSSFLLSPSFASTTTICPFESIYQFGDSISDVGNLIREGPAGARSYAARYPYGETFFGRATGRCSNGLLMIDYFALALRLPFLNPYLGGPNMAFDHGANFAVAGSTALPPSFFMERNIHVPSTDNHLKVQLNWFHAHLNSTCQTSADCRKRLQRALVFMGEIGGNDYNYAFFQGKPIDEIRTYVPHVVREITDAVREVIQAGAIRIVVPGNFPIGCIPIYLTSFPSSDPRSYDDMQCLGGLNEFAMFHNDYLQGALEQLRQEYPHAVIIYGDYYTAFQSVIRRAPSLGFERTSLMKACCGIGGPYNYDGSRMCGSPGVPVCPNPDQHIHWDGVHLTQGAYRHMADWLLNDLLPRKVQCVW